MSTNPCHPTEKEKQTYSNKGIKVNYYWCENCDEHWKGERVCPNCGEKFNVRKTMSPEEAEAQGLK